jgi:uncharacterized protein YabE (DUF348 family)
MAMPASVKDSRTAGSSATTGGDRSFVTPRASGRSRPRAARRIHHGWYVVVVLLLLLGGGVAGYVALSSVVDIHVDGEVRSVRTLAADVGGVLDQVGVEVGADDRVEPAPDTPVEDGLRVVVHRAITVEVVVDGGQPLTVVTTSTTVEEVLREAGLGDLLAGEARIDPAPGTPIADDARIVIGLPVLVTIAVDGEVLELQTHAGTVAGALEDAGVELGDHDRVQPPLAQTLDGATDVTVRRVELVEEVVEVTIEHGEVRRDTSELVEGETRVETPGSDGVRRETYQVTLVDGDATGRVLLDEEVLQEPTDQVVLVGTASGPVREVQRLLADLGYPVGPVDGVEGAQTRRGLCAWRRLEGLDVSRGSLRPGELEALRATTALPAASAGRGVTVDRTCQVAYYRQDGQWQHVHQASTGADGLPSPGSYVIQRTRAGWHTSTLYPAPTPNMYNTLYFHGAIAIHGSNHVPAHPASAGCVRVTPAAADQLFGSLRVGDPVAVIGSY